MRSADPLTTSLCILRWASDLQSVCTWECPFRPNPRLNLNVFQLARHVTPHTHYDRPHTDTLGGRASSSAVGAYTVCKPPLTLDGFHTHHIVCTERTTQRFTRTVRQILSHELRRRSEHAQSSYLNLRFSGFFHSFMCFPRGK